MTVDDFLEGLAAEDLRGFAIKGAGPQGRAPETVDALFFMPLLALTVMVIARRTPFPTVALGRSVSALLVEHFVSLRHSPHALEDSITLRRRCANALAFLETVGLAVVSEDQARMIRLTEAGRKHLDGSMGDEGDLGLLMRRLRITQERVKARFGSNGR